MKWLDELERQIGEQQPLSSMHKLTPDWNYQGMFYLVHPDWVNRLIEIAKRAEWGGGWSVVLWSEGTPSCPICECAVDEGHDVVREYRRGKWVVIGPCPYSDEWRDE